MIDAYVEELTRELREAGVTGADGGRLLEEARGHLDDAAAEHGEAAAVAAFGPARVLATVVAAELATARTRRAGYAAFLALAPVGLVYAILFVTFPAGTAQRSGSVPGLGPAALAGAVFFPQLAFVCGLLAVLRLLRRRGASELPAADLGVVRSRAAFALAGGALTLASLGVLALDQRSAIAAWWLAGALASLGVFAPVLAAVGLATARSAHPRAAVGEPGDTAVEDVGAVLAHVPVLSRFRMPASPRRFALLVAVAVAVGVAAAGVVQHDPLDGLLRALAEGAAVLACYGLFGRRLALRR